MLEAHVTRRRFIVTGAAAVAALAGCGGPTEPDPSRVRLRSRPSTPTKSIGFGLQPLGLGGARDALLYVPRSYRADRAMPLVVLLHGATGSAESWFGSYGDRAEQAGVLFLAVDSRGGTWDAINGGFGADVAFIDSALAWTFERCAVDGHRIGMAGFSDGATYGLSLGLANGDLFRGLIGYSPGFVIDTGFRGTPKVFISHGVSDNILTIELASRLIVPALRDRGYAVDYHEFDGGHEVPGAISTLAVGWFMAL